VGFSQLLGVTVGRLLYLMTDRPLSVSIRRLQIFSNSSVPGCKCKC